MTTEKLTVTVDDSDVVKLNETLGDTEKQLKEVDKAADKAGDAIDGAGESAGAMGAAMGALGIAAAAAGAALAVAANASAIYAEKTAGTETALNTFLNSMDRFNLTLGESIVESDGVTRALAIFDNALNNSEGAVDGFAGVISSLVDGGLFVLEAAMQTGTATMGLYRLAVVAAEGAIDTIDTNIRQAAGTVEIMTLAVIDLGLSLGEGLIGMVQLAITKLGEFASAIAPYAARIGLDLSAVTTAIDGTNEALTTQLTSLRAMGEQARNSGLTVLAEQEEQLALYEERRNGRAEESIAIIEETGETMMATAGAFNAGADAIERTTRATEGAAGAAGVLNKSLQDLLVTQTNLGLIEEKRAAFAMAQAQAAIAGDKEAERQAEANLGLKMQAEALAGIQTALEGVSGASATAATTVSENLLTLLDSLSPINQAMDVFKASAAELGMSAVEGLTDSLLSGKNVGKEFKAFIGDMLATQGKAAILQGTLQLIPFTPMFNPASGAAQLLQGGLMVGAGKALGATGGGGGGGGGSTAPTVAAPSQGSSSSTYVTNNFQGMFNDPREASRVIGDATEQAALRGTL